MILINLRTRPVFYQFKRGIKGVDQHFTQRTHTKYRLGSRKFLTKSSLFHNSANLVFELNLANLIDQFRVIVAVAETMHVFSFFKS